ncbi:MAG: conjugal transfer protein TraF [Crenarchaeota archaeon]|nr:conjugal transfer protein TraF [Thermoproteota archaeon]
MGYSIEIDERTREAIREILSSMTNPVKIVLYRDKFCEWTDINWCEITKQVVSEIAKLSPDSKIIFEEKKLSENAELLKLLEPTITSRVKVPVVCIGDNCEIIYLGAPVGEEIRTFLDSIILASTRKTNLSPRTREELKNIIKQLPRRLYIVTLVTQACPYCPYAASLANSFAVEGEGKIVSIVYDASLDPELAEEYGITMVPAIIMGLEGFKGRLEFIGIPSEADLLERIIEHVKMGR